jgi:hypothetical protein
MWKRQLNHKSKEEKMEIRAYDVVIDSQSAIQKMEPFVRMGVKGVNFVVKNPNLEAKILEDLERFSAKFRVQIVVRDKSIMRLIDDIGRWMLVGGVLGFAIYVFLPLTPGLGTCVLGGAALGALHSSLKIRVGRDLDGQMVLTTA